MASKSWKGGTGNWTDATQWNGGLPAAGDNVLIGTGRVDITSNVGGIGSLQNNALLDMKAGKLFVSGTLTNNGILDVDSLDAYSGKSVLTVENFINHSVLDIGNYLLAAPSTMTVTTFVNTDLVSLLSNPTQAITLDIKSAAGDGSAGHLQGYYDLSGNALIEFASGAITTLDGDVELKGASARIAIATDTTTNSALQSLALVSLGGGLGLDEQAVLHISGNLTNRGTIGVDRQTQYDTGGSQLSVTGTLSNSGIINLADYYLGASDSVTAGAFINDGQFNAAGGGPTGGSGTSLLSITGQMLNRGSLVFNAASALADGSFTQTAAGTTEVQFTDTAQNAPITSTGGVSLRGGIVYVDLSNGFVAGQTYALMTFAPGHLTGVFDQISINHSLPSDGSGTAVTVAGGTLKAGLLYNDAAGTIQVVVAAAPATTIDTFTAAGGAWTNAGNWSAGVPTFYSDVAIGAHPGTVTLASDATVNSIALSAGSGLNTAIGTDLSVGATFAVGSGASATIGGQMTVDSAVTDNGTVRVNGTADIRGNSSDTGGYMLGAGATLEFGAAAGNTVTFAGAGASLILDRSYQFTGTLTNLVAGDVIDIADVQVSSATVSGTTLTVKKADTATVTYKLANLRTGTGFTVQSDGGSGSKLVVTPIPGFSGSGMSAALARPAALHAGLAGPQPTTGPAPSVLFDHATPGVLT